MRVVTREIPPFDRPLDRDPDHVWMSPEVSLWGWGEATRFDPGTGQDRISRLEAELTAAWEEAEVDDEVERPGSGPVAFVSVTFAPGSPGSVGLIPRRVVGRSGATWWTTSVDEGPEPPPPRDGSAHPDRARYAGSSMPDVMWLEAVSEALEAISQGSVTKVVLARDYAVWSRHPFAPATVLSSLAERFPSCQIFRVADLVGASPEMLVRRRKGRMTSLVLAGSAPSHVDPVADREAARRLLGSAKDRWEHELAVQSVEQALGRAGIRPRLLERAGILRLDNVQHLATTVDAESGDLGALELVAILHPTAAVGGTPTPEALQLIRRLEGMDRGRYAGPVGWVDSDGNGDFAIALRCAELSGARARLFAGVGIVEGSLPEAELEETRLKLQAMIGALGAS